MQETKEKREEEKRKKEDKAPVSACIWIYDFISFQFHWGSVLCSFFLLSCQLLQKCFIFQK